MVLALGVSAIVALALVSDILIPRVIDLLAKRHARRQLIPDAFALDPGRERRAEQRARELLRSCVTAEEWAMYRELGFIRVWGDRLAVSTEDGAEGPESAYLIYAHKPIVAYVPQSSRLLSEYCVEFPDHERPYGSARLPASDDVLAKWLALTADERSLIESANLHLAGRQLDPDTVRADLASLARWERRRNEQLARDASAAGAGSVGAQ